MCVNDGTGGTAHKGGGGGGNHVKLRCTVGPFFMMAAMDGHQSIQKKKQSAGLNSCFPDSLCVVDFFL